MTKKHCDFRRARAATLKKKEKRIKKNVGTPGFSAFQRRVLYNVIA